MMEEITRWLIFALWLMMAGIWLPNILQVVWWRFNAWSWLVVWVLPAFGLIPRCPTTLQFWLLMALGAVVFLPAPADAARADGPPGRLLRDDPAARLVGTRAPRGRASRA